MVGGVLASHFCCNRLPQTYWLRATQIYYLILGANSPKWVLQGSTQCVRGVTFLLEPLGVNEFLVFSKLLEVVHGPWPLSSVLKLMDLIFQSLFFSLIFGSILPFL